MSEAQRWTDDEAKAAVREVIRKAATDGEFRARALGDANAAFEEVAGRPLPEGFTLRFVESGGADRTIVLPELGADGELSEVELEAAAGGGYEFFNSLDIVTKSESRGVTTLFAVRKPDFGLAERPEKARRARLRLACAESEAPSSARYGCRALG